ncbi:hypothetical protein [Nonomuraea salmonea]|uniref:MurR/RpiR family transcriptional regulator n=1 Tax=Nonomuraea salmonea TaxID=46181 RepID=UPI0031E5789C
MLEDPATVARSTITELSAASGTSEATIVRTARLLGFAGYPQLRLALAAAAAQPDRLVPGDLAPPTTRCRRSSTRWRGPSRRRSTTPSPSSPPSGSAWWSTPSSAPAGSTPTASAPPAWSPRTSPRS